MAESGDSTGGEKGPTAPDLEVSKCAVCMDCTMTPGKSCKQGNLVCKKCTHKSTRFPHCKSKLSTDLSFSKDGPPSVKALPEALPRACRYAGSGCTETVENGGHEEFCGFRPFLDAFESSPGKKLLVRDLKDFHSSQRDRYSHDGRKLLMVYSLGSSGPSTVACPCVSKLCLFIVPLFAFDTFCLLSVFRYEPDRKFVMVFVAFFTATPEIDVFIRVTFEKDEDRSYFTLKASRDAENGKLDKGSVVNVNCGRIDKFITNRTLNLGYEIFTKPK